MTLYQKLRWLIQMGVNETIADSPVNRLEKKEKAPPTNHSAPFKPVTISPADNIVQQSITIATKAQDIASLATALQTFDASPLKKTAAHTLFARGNPAADIMIIGDIPEATDDLSGQIFAGEVGDLFTKMMGAIGLNVDTHCYTTLLLPWRTPGGRKPTPAETAYCLPFVKRHIELASPKILILFGALTSGALLGIDSLSRARGSWHLYQSEKLPAPIPTLVTLSPSYLIKNQTHKKHAWEDLKRLQAKINESDFA